MKAEQLVAAYGSPAYVYELGAVRDSHRALKQALPDPSRIYYSLKSNPHPSIVRQVIELGCHCEVCSIGELQTVLDCGGDPQQVLYTGPGKSRKEIRFALSSGVTHFSVDSLQEISKVVAEAEAQQTPVQLVLRINPDRPVPGLGLTMTGGPSQFGIDASKILLDPAEYAQFPFADVIGYHIYMGTNITEDDTLLKTFLTAVELAEELSEALGIEPQILDLGGGFGHAFAKRGERLNFQAIRAPLVAELEKRFPRWREGAPLVAFESGRYLAAPSGYLLCTVEDVKRSKNLPFVILDAGIHHLGGMSGLGRVPRIGLEFLLPEQPERELIENCQVVGP
ncbi:MAG TPA: type III PLP-dependent enzyme, partial [Bacilli bacterium]|nr:type III PLP-dependent enzyme [Bacilli bacterium]